MFDLKGKVAMVTGATSGIGLAYVKELLRNELKGVALVDINVKDGQEALMKVRKSFGNDRAIFLKADVSDRAQLEGAFKTTVEIFHQLDIVINNAGIVQEIQWEKCVAVNLVGTITGSMLAMEKYLPKYKSGSEGVILNTSSLAIFMSFEGYPTYSATKSAVVALTRALGGDLHYKTNKVRVIAICPGGTDTSILNITKEQVTEPYLNYMINACKSIVAQTPEAVAKNAVELIKKAPNGSVWIAEQGKCVEAELLTYNP